MPRKTVVIKTYGRHKFRTIKTDPWISPDDAFCSPVSKKERISRSRDPSTSPTTFTSCTWKTPLTDWGNVPKSCWGVLKPQSSFNSKRKGKENTSPTNLEVETPQMHAWDNGWKNSTPLKDDTVNSPSLSGISEGSALSVRSSKEKSSVISVNDSDMSEDFSENESSGCSIRGKIYRSRSTNRVPNMNTEYSKTNCSGKAQTQVIPESPLQIILEEQDAIEGALLSSTEESTNSNNGRSYHSVCSSISEDSIRCSQNFDQKSLSSQTVSTKISNFDQVSIELYMESPLTLIPQQVNKHSMGRTAPHATSTPVIRANSRNSQLVTTRGRRKPTTHGSSSSLSDCKVLVEPLKLTPLQYEAARIRSFSDKSSLCAQEISKQSKLSLSACSSTSALDSCKELSSCCLNQMPVEPARNYLNEPCKMTRKETDTRSASTNSSTQNLVGSFHNYSKRVGDVVLDSSISQLGILGASTLDSEQQAIAVELAKKWCSGDRGSLQRGNTYAGSLMDCVISLERLKLAPSEEESLGRKRTSERKLSVGTCVNITCSSSSPPLTPPRKQASHMSFMEALTPAKNTASDINQEEMPQTLNPYQKILLECEQATPITFQQYLKPSVLNKCTKIGEGVYGEVFKTVNNHKQSVALKIIPINGDFDVNEEPQKSYEEIIPEIIISKELSALNHSPDEEFEENLAPNFVEVYRVTLIQDQYPTQLIKEWDKWDNKHESENDRPDIFPSDQYFIVFEFANGGQDMEHYEFRSLSEATSVLQQTALSLAAAESALEFEHRDLHWGNVLIARTNRQELEYWVNGERFEVASHGICVSIIDFTLSRLRKDGVTVYCNMSEDESLFTGKGDHQFEVYRLMRKYNGDEWETFNPFTNVLWLHYLADKILRNKDYPKPDRTLEARLKRYIRQVQQCQCCQEVIYEEFFT